MAACALGVLEPPPQPASADTPPPASAAPRNPRRVVDIGLAGVTATPRQIQAPPSVDAMRSGSAMECPTRRAGRSAAGAEALPAAPGGSPGDRAAGRSQHCLPMVRVYRSRDASHESTTLVVRQHRARRRLRGRLTSSRIELRAAASVHRGSGRVATDERAAGRRGRHPPEWIADRAARRSRIAVDRDRLLGCGRRLPRRFVDQPAECGAVPRRDPGSVGPGVLDAPISSGPAHGAWNVSPAPQHQAGGRCGHVIPASARELPRNHSTTGNGVASTGTYQ